MRYVPRMKPSPGYPRRDIDGMIVKHPPASFSFLLLLFVAVVGAVVLLALFGLWLGSVLG